jgi:PQQ-like domain
VVSVIIDLDRMPPATAERTRRRPARHARPVPVVLLLVALLLLLGGGAPPAPPAPPGLVSVLTLTDPVVTSQLAAGSLFLATPDEVRRYDLATGSLRWRHPSRQNVQDVRFDPVAGVVLMFSGQRPWITALDAADGRVRWQGGSNAAWTGATTPGGVLTRTEGEGRDRLRLLDARTGRERWHRDVGSPGQLGPRALYTAGGSSRIVWISAAGEMTVFRDADGAALMSDRLDAGGADVATATFVGDRLYVTRPEAERTVLAAYAVPSGARLWELDDAPGGDVSGCGPVLCVSGAFDVSGVDPASGAVRWAQRDWAGARRFDAERLFVYDARTEPEAALIDAGTGRMLRRLGHSRLVGDLLLRTADSRTVVMVRAAGTGDLRAVGTLEDVAALRCAAADRFLTCPSFSGETKVWRVG